MVSLNDIFWFGKYKGHMIEDIVYDNPNYVKWCLENVENFDLNEEDTDTVMNAYYEISDDFEDYIDIGMSYFGN